MSRDQTYRYVIMAWTVLLWLVATFAHLDYAAVLFGLLSGFFAVCNVIIDRRLRKEGSRWTPPP